MAGLVSGFIVGSQVAPSLSTTVTHAHWRPGVALGIVLLASLLGGILGRLLGSFILNSLRVLKLGLADRIAGVVVGSVGALAGCWLLAGLLAATTWGSLASEIQQSAILSAVDQVMPPIPSIEARVQALLRNSDFPTVFANVTSPTLDPIVRPAMLGPSVRSLGSPSDVVKVLASGACGTISEGSAFYVADHEVVTNAHVVAGHTHVTVNGALATVARYDPDNDVAVLRVTSQSAPALRFLAKRPSRAMAIEVIGFPLNASRTGAPGYVEGELTSKGRDIYNQNLHSRLILALEVNIEPGNSGSPVLDGPFVIGMIQSRSTSLVSTAYAIPASVIEHDIAATPSSGAASTQSCLS